MYSTIILSAIMYEDHYFSLLVVMNPYTMCWVTDRFAYESFRLLSVRLRLESIRLRPICQFDRRVSDDKN